MKAKDARDAVALTAIGLLLLATVVYIVGITVLAVNGLPDKEADAIKALQNQGYTSIEITGQRLFDCSQGDINRVGFVAVNPNSKRVTGVVCSGLVKSHTIRFD